MVNFLLYLALGLLALWLLWILGVIEFLFGGGATIRLDAKGYIVVDNWTRRFVKGKRHDNLARVHTSVDPEYVPHFARYDDARNWAKTILEYNWVERDDRPIKLCYILYFNQHYHIMEGSGDYKNLYVKCWNPILYTRLAAEAIPYASAAEAKHEAGRVFNHCITWLEWQLGMASVR